MGGGENRPLCRNRLLTGYNAAALDLARGDCFLVIVSAVTFGWLETPGTLNLGHQSRYLIHLFAPLNFHGLTVEMNKRLILS